MSEHGAQIQHEIEAQNAAGRVDFHQQLRRLRTIRRPHRHFSQMFDVAAALMSVNLDVLDVKVAGSWFAGGLGMENKLQNIEETRIVLSACCY